VGTHTLIEDPILFSQLELVVIDEQHRFGVGQRAALRAKGTNPHLLVMTATPIPRSLSLTIYGDLDLSVIDEMPPGRQEIGTHLLLPRERERAYKLIRREAHAGRQAFIIYPLIEESETSETKAAVDEQKRLKKEVFPDLKVELLHGRLNAEDKDKAMAAFRDGKAQVMVSTTVMEVGVDIPNATVMLIEGANRFGLAQLHQLRGRVGRGAEKSYCILIPDHEDAAENERLQALLETNDGFILAEKDLAQRGPGQFLGRQQSGFLDFRLASLSDARLIDKARRQAEQLLTADPTLSQPQHHALAIAVKNYLSDGKGDLS
jgi:ATP-dependent DNA helicase RecG